MIRNTQTVIVNDLICLENTEQSTSLPEIMLLEESYSIDMDPF